MLLRTVSLFAFVVGVFGDFGSFGNFGGVPSFGSQTNAFDQSVFNSQNQAQGGGAGAGQAGAGAGTAQSINQANHQADGKRTQSSGMNANTAQGTGGVSAGGAAQAQGQTAGQKAGQQVKGFNSQNVGTGFDSGFGGNFGGFNSGGLNGGGFNGGGLNGGGFVGQPGGFNGGGLSGGGLGGNFGSQTSDLSGQNFQKQHQSGGTAAGAGTATALQGTAQSVNQAQQDADENGDQESGLSSNAADGLIPQVQGAAQAQGETDKAAQGSRFGQHGFNQFGNFGSR